LRIFFPDVLDMPLPPGHRFPGGKYRLLREKAEREGFLGSAELVPSPPASEDQLKSVHASAYVDAVFNGTLDATAQRRIGLPLTPTLVARSRATVGGSLAAARAALETGLSGQLAGGTHHAHYDFGSGFCVFNDLAVTAKTLLGEGVVQRIAIVDLDVHQGDGNAALLTADPRVFVFSMHGARNFPFRKVASDLDVGLDDGTDDAIYLRALEDALPAVVAFRPDLVLYLSGADPLAADRLGRMAMTHEGLMARDRRIFDTFRRQGVPVSIAIGGGYAEPIEASVEAYANTFKSALDVHRKA
jgi:acetoin utilization deacetylase AcuC-like enzyme